MTTENDNYTYVDTTQKTPSELLKKTDNEFVADVKDDKGEVKGKISGTETTGTTTFTLTPTPRRDSK